ncbi:hypothetical protein ACH5RR_034865 [Cinchona calisaya]|uniref:DUF676 domain-containing protein n=1 Tax=Cinchona calisaya TaxID=153742 RepID=A0ABD2YFH0_9GENT
MAAPAEEEKNSSKTIEDKKPEMKFNNNNSRNRKKKMKKRRISLLFLRKFSCMRTEEEDEFPTTTIDEEAAGGEGSFNMQAVMDHAPTHLIVMVNGIIGSAQNWRYAAKQFVKAYPRDVLVHCSESNSSILTFDGVDVMGKRLADEVLSVVQKHPNLQKISFISHSLGGLVTRYAIAELYGKDFSRKSNQENGDRKLDGFEDASSEDKCKGKIAGLDPVNFITFATPHLGSRGHRQVPVFCGLYTLENVASHTAWILGRTGKHLFLTDSDDGKPPLLLQMVNDSEDLKFISALQSFKRRVVYANVRYDHLVGWSTSSLRRRNELPKRRDLLKKDKYPHIVNIETAKTPVSQEENSLDLKVKKFRITDMEEAMLRSLTKLSWERVDVNFSGSKQRFFAHNTIQVQNYSINSDGADVIQHKIDSFLLWKLWNRILRQDSTSSTISSTLSFTGRSIPKFPVKGLEANHKKVVMERSLIGSRPPRCERRCSSRSCGGGGHCEAVQVPIVPSKNQQQTTIFTTTYSRGDDISNYKPMCWKCKCGDFIFNP